jgi:glucose-6-phosphate 1-dehydrogenase
MPTNNSMTDLQERVSPPCAIVIFGASGDLTKRKLVPALFRLYEEKLLPEEFAIVGISRSAMTHDEFRTRMQEAIAKYAPSQAENQEAWQKFAKGIFYVPGDLSNERTYTEVRDLLETIDSERGTAGNRVFYLSTAPEHYSEAVKQLGNAGLAKSDQPSDKHAPFVRIIVEKPFGMDLQSAIELNTQVAAVFDEDQVYRIDHYLGKETVQNLLVFRFANGIFEPIWNHRYIDHVQITNAECLGVEGRGAYYESSGVMRDMIQNHVFQVLSLVAMEPPNSLAANAVRDEKIKAMQAVRPFPLDRLDEFVVRGQYGAGFIDGRPVAGYREEPGVHPESTTETYTAMKLFFDNWRWSGVPFYIRSAKRMPKRITEIAIQFKEVPHLLFGKLASEQIEPNVLVIRIQPNEGITLRFGAKVPGQMTKIRWVNMDFLYQESFDQKPPEAYERLLLDCILGDSTLYARRDMTERGWEIVMPVLDAWKKTEPEFPNYMAGTWGSPNLDWLIKQDGRKWRKL